MRNWPRMTIPTDPVIGVDVGASTISAGLVCPDGTVLATTQAPTQGGGPVVDTIFTLVDRALASAQERRLRVAGIGVGLPGLVDVEKGFMRSMTGAWLHELGDVPLAALIQERSGHPVFVDNDVNALALGEWMFGLGRGTSSLVTVAIGTGMGGGLILDGRLVRGHLHSAGEIGHLTVSFDGPLCVCGSFGCLATYVAGGMMSERARERLACYPTSGVLTRAGGDPARIGAALLFEAAAAGDPLAHAVVDEACEALAIGIGALVNLLNPEVIVITGGVAASLAPLQDEILRRVRRRALTAVLDATTVRVVPIDKRATVRGGAALVLYETARRGQDS
ncbi:MAG TPA: ROK family protein [Candidatus Udaeobacter sp.]|nr:ROK family protein [Candidatus Udaeobacter sp.]